MRIRTIRNRKARHHKQRLRQRFRSRLLRHEALECRALLSATPLEVNTFEDVVDLNDDSTISLREAVIRANQSDGDAEIQLQAGTYWLTEGGADNEDAYAGDLDVVLGGSVTIMGAGAGETIINAGGDDLDIDPLGDRVFEVHSGASLSVGSLAVRGGTADRGGGFFVDGGTLELTAAEVSENAATSSGGGISNDHFGSVSLADSIVAQNTAGLVGGGIDNTSGSLDVSNSILSENTTLGFGGGIHNTSSGNSVSVTNSTLERNEASFGGGVFNFYDPEISGSGPVSSVILTNSTLSQNAATSGGGIHNESGSVDIANSTLTGNRANTDGGGIYNIHHGSVSLANSTITGNRSNADGSDGGTGGGMQTTSDATLHHTIVAGNFRGTDATVADEIGGAVSSSSSFNLIADPTTAGGLSDGSNGNIVATMPIADILDPTLADNGGPTLTHALAPGGPAVDAGDPGFDESDLPYDQRGEHFERIIGGRIDIGAYEVQQLLRPSVFLDDNGNLVIQDVTSDSRDDLLTLSRDGASVRVHDPSNTLTAGSDVAQADAHTVEIAFASITGQVLIGTAGGDDRVTIDFSGSNPIPSAGISLDAGVGGFDALEVTGGEFGTSTYTYDNANDGSIRLDPDGSGGADASLITYAGLEPINSSVTSDVVELMYTGGSETITASDAGNGQTTVDSTLGEITTFTNPSARLSIHATNGIDTVDVNSLANGYASLEVQGDDAADVVNFNGALTLTADHDLTVSDVGTVNLPAATSDVETSGTGAVSLTALRNIALASGSSIATIDGGIALEANQQATTASGNFVGIDVYDATLISSGTGGIHLSGRGGDSGAHNYGIQLQDGAKVQSTATGADAARIILEGVGGSGTSGNVGITSSGRRADTEISAVDGDILITGQGGDGSTSANRGVYLADGTDVSSTGTGTEAAAITIHGAGGQGTWNNDGVFLGSYPGSGMRIVSVEGDISITGQGGKGSNSSNRGVSLHSSAKVESTGIGANAAKITIDGTGGTGTLRNYGVRASGDVTSVDGEIRITGRAGGREYDNIGVYLYGGAVSSTGTGPDAAEINIAGTGGDGTSKNHGVYVVGSDAQVTSSDGDVSINGQGGDASENSNYGVYLRGGEISSTGTGADAAGITINGAAGSGTFLLHGVRISNADTNVTTVDGDILIIGQGGDAPFNFSHGVSVDSSAAISSTGSGADAGKISIDGAVRSDSFGVSIINSGTRITSIDGNIFVSGQRGGSVYVTNGAEIASVGTGAEAASVTIEGFGVSGTSRGTVVRGLGTEVTSVDGDILISGQGGDGDHGNHGLNVAGGAKVSSTGTGVDAAAITLNGTGGSGSRHNHGVLMHSDAHVTSVDGPILVTGQAGGDGSGGSNRGVALRSSALISSSGTGADAATITINGAGGSGTRDNDGVFLGSYQSSGTGIRSVDGDIQISGQGGNGSSFRNHGVYLTDGAEVSSTGAGTGAATIVIDGTGGQGTAANDGVSISSSGTQVTSVDGDIEITGAADDGSSTAVKLLTISGVLVTDTATVTVVADSMKIGAEDAIVAGSSTVTVRPKTSGRGIDLGASSARTLSLTDSGLDHITAGTLVIGASNSGDIVVSRPITRASSTDLELHSGGGIIFDPGSLDTGGGDLLLAPGTGGVQPLSSGVDTTADAVSFASDLHIPISGPTLDTEYAQLNVDGTVDLAGVDLVLTGSYVPANGDVFTIVRADSLANQFNGLDDGDELIFNGQSLKIDYTPTAVTLTADLSPEEQIANLQDAVTSLVDAGELNTGQGRGLSSVLDASLDQLDRDSTTPAINQLEAFIHKLNAFMKSGRLDEASGNPLVTAAEEAIQAIEDEELQAAVHNEIFGGPLEELLEV